MAKDTNGSAPAYDDIEKRDSVDRRGSRRMSRKEGWEKDDPFGDETNSEIKYRTLTWSAMIMIAETISLGILSLPSVLDTVGMAPGIILILGLGIIATYTGYVIGQFKQAYPFVHTMADAGQILFEPFGPLAGKIGKEFLGACQVIFLIFSMASHILTWTICLNTLTNGTVCTIVWGVVGLAIFFICDLPRTLKNMSWLSITSFISIFSAVMITMIAVGVDPQGVGLAATKTSSFQEAFLSVSNIIFAYAGHVAFFTFISELKDVNDFPKALYVLQAVDTGLYIIVAAIIYRYTGDQVASPALGSASSVVEKVAYGIAIPTIIVAGVIYGHVATKYIYVRIFRGTHHMHQRTWFSFGTWALIALTIWVIAWIIAESIPDFEDLLALISSLFASWFTYGISGIFWLFMNKGQWFKSSKNIMLTIVNWLLVLMALLIMGAGLYASGTAIAGITGAGSWTCADNSE